MILPPKSLNLKPWATLIGIFRACRKGTYLNEIKNERGFLMRSMRKAMDFEMGGVICSYTMCYYICLWGWR